MDKTTYILGAGFSRYAGLPLMNDFYFKSKDIYPNLPAETQKSFEIIFKYFDDFSKVKHIMNADFYNIEELLSIIEMDTFIQNKNKIKKHYLTYLKTVIETLTPELDQQNFMIINKNNHSDMYTNFIQEVFGIEYYTDTYIHEEYYKRNDDNENGVI
ncbi:MAG: hypothetical protein WAR79_08935 [Melioribacteraceae bacterium]